MDFKQMYQEKLVSAEKAASVIKSGDWVDYGWTTATPVAVDKAIAKRLPELTDVNFRGGILMWVPEIFKIENPAEHMTWNSWHMGGIERKAIAQGFSYYAPIRYSELPRYYRESQTKPDVAVFQVSPMDEHGFFNFGPNASHMAAVCETSKVVIVEVNENMPVCFGGTEEGVHISHVDMIVEGDNPAIAEMGGAAAASDVDEAVAKLILEEIPDGACLQLGIGGMPNAVGALIAKSDLKDLGVHTEMYVDAFVDIANAGKITGARKNIDKGRQVYAFGAGTKKLYDYLNKNPECMSAPVDYTNDVRTISALDNFMSINNAVDLDGLKAPGQRRVDAGHGLLEPAQAGDLFKQHGSSVSSEMLTRLSPASLSCGASLGSRAPLVVSEMSSICGIARMSRMSVMIRRPTSGSPPVRRTRRMPPPPPGAQSGRFPRR